MDLSTFGPVSKLPRACATAACAARDAVNTPQLGIVFMPIDADHAGILARLSAQTQLPFIGATTGGVGFTERG